jgi:hypothetical protein
MDVTSAPQAAFGPGGSKSRPRTFSATGRPCRASVVRANRLAVFARIPWVKSKVATVFSFAS